MINGNINQFLDTGWFTEATLFLNGYIYWLEAQANDIETVFLLIGGKLKMKTTNIIILY